MFDPRCLSQIVALADDDKIQVDRVFSLIAVKFVVADQPLPTSQFQFIIVQRLSRRWSQYYTCRPKLTH